MKSIYVLTLVVMAISIGFVIGHVTVSSTSNAVPRSQFMDKCYNSANTPNGLTYGYCAKIASYAYDK